jgi:hypothetical protein
VEPLRLDALSWLDAINGIAYLVGSDGTIIKTGKNWNSFATTNGAPEIADDKLVGKNLFASV